MPGRFDRAFDAFKSKDHPHGEPDQESDPKCLNAYCHYGE
jgi:hypothetical protein